MSSYANWTPERKAQLVELYKAGLTTDGIADRMGLKYEQINSALKRGRTGAWGAEIAAILKARRGDSIDATASEAKEKGVSYGQLQLEKLRAAEQPITEPEQVEPEVPQASEPEAPEEVAPLYMLTALYALEKFASDLGAEKLLEVRASATTGKAGVTFKRAGRTYTLVLTDNDVEE